MYFDYFKRDNKSGGAWMSNFVDQSKLLGTKPVIYNVANFTKPAPGQPALISFDDVTTMFHEFGHALHGLFANQNYPTLSGTNVARDFVEFPSQFNEHWALYPEVLKHYAVNYKTGAADPAGAGGQDQEVADTGARAMRWANCWRPPSSTCSGMTLPAGRAEAGCRCVRDQGAEATRAPTSPTCRRAIAPAISCTSGPTAMRPAITPINGR